MNMVLGKTPHEPRATYHFRVDRHRELIGRAEVQTKHWRWMPWSSNGTWREAVIPLWPLTVGCAATVCWLWLPRAARRGRAGRCPTCAYDRCGLPEDAVCPECGAKPAKR
jgi:hypothetical protein